MTASFDSQYNINGTNFVKVAGNSVSLDLGLDFPETENLWKTLPGEVTAS